MKFVVLLLMIGLSTVAYQKSGIQTPESPQWRTELVKKADGTESKFTLMRRGVEIRIHARHRMGDGSFRETIIEDQDADGIVDRASRIGVVEEDERMDFDRSTAVGMKYFGEWQDEWDESVYQIEKLLGHSIRASVVAAIP